MIGVMRTALPVALATLLSTACADMLELDRYAQQQPTGAAATTAGSGGTGGSGGTSAVTGGAPPAYADAVQALQPIAYWRMGEATGTVASDSANDFDGTYTGGFTLAEPGLIAGDPDTAARMGGTGYVAVSDMFDFLGTSSFTFELWVKSDDPAIETMLLDKLEGGPPCNGYRFWFDSTGVHFLRCNNDTLETIDFVGNLKMSVPTYLVARYDSTAQTMCIFINGGDAPVCSPAVQPLPDTAASLALGFNLVGVIDEVAIYGEALDDAVFGAHHVLGATP